MAMPMETESAAAAAGLRPSSDAQRQAFTLLNASTAPVWLAMILFPRAR